MLQIQRKSCLPWGEIVSVVEMFCMDIVYSLLPLRVCRAPNEAMGVNAVSKQPCSSTVFPSKRFFLSPFMGKHKARVQREICWSQHFTKQHSNIGRLGSSINTCATKLCFFTEWKWWLLSTVGVSTQTPTTLTSTRKTQKHFIEE